MTRGEGDCAPLAIYLDANISVNNEWQSMASSTTKNLKNTYKCYMACVWYAMCVCVKRQAVYLS